MKTFQTGIILILFLMQLPGNAYGQKLFRVDYRSQADICIYEVEYESQCDLKVFFVEYESQADEPGLWYYTDYESQADKTIFFVDYESQADLKIYYVDYESQAGWRNPEKGYLFIQEDR